MTRIHTVALLLLAAPLPAAAVPRIDALTPDQGPTTGESVVVITGSGFASTDSVILTVPFVSSPPGDDCGDGQPLCSSGQCVLSAVRGPCTINGTPGYLPFVYLDPGQIEIRTPSVGCSAAGPAVVFVRSDIGVPSNLVAYTFQAVPPALIPTISMVFPTSLAGDGCCAQGYVLLVLGANFRKCSSLVLRGSSSVHELLPTPDVSDCAVARGCGNMVSPRERLTFLLRPDGETIDCATRPDLVPLRQTGTGTYQHDAICYAGVRTDFCPLTAVMIPSGGDPNDVTNGGAFTWINENEIRLLFGPDVLPGCGNTEWLTFYVSNDPGRGLTGDLLSNGFLVTFTDTMPDPVPPEQGNVLRAVRDGVDVLFEFPAAPASLWLLQHDPAKDRIGRTTLAEVDVTTARDPLAVRRSGDEYYYLRGLSPCSRIPGL